MDADDRLVAVSLLATGASSRVVLCSARGANPTEPILLKSIRLCVGNVNRVQREINISRRDLGTFVMRSHGWLVTPLPRLEVFLRLDYCPGADIDLLIDREGALSPATARFYAACALLGLERLHELGIAHRDVKPDNLLLGGDGYVRIGDLGYAIELTPKRLTPAPHHEEADAAYPYERATTLLGTPEYLPPEGFLGEGQDTRSDLWSLGVTLYVMTLASHPWGGDSPHDVYERVLREPLFFTANAFLFSEPAKAFLRACLHRDAAARPSPAGAFAHDFFASVLPPTYRGEGVDRSALLAKQIRPPFVPRLREGPFDASYFRPPPNDDGSSGGEGSSDEGESGTASASSRRWLPAGGSAATVPAATPPVYMAVVQPDGETDSCVRCGDAAADEASATVGGGAGGRRAEHGGGGDAEGFVEGLELLPPEACELSRYRDALCDDLLGGVS